MTPGPDPQKGTPKNKSTQYFTIGAALLLMMALLSSVDSSIVATLFGAAAFCFFFGFYKLPGNANASGNSQRYSTGSRKDTYTRTPPPTAGKSFDAKELWNQFLRTNNPFSTTGSAESKKKAALKIFLIVFGLMFTIPILISILSSGGGNYASAYKDIAEQNFNSGQIDSAKYYYRMALREDPEYEEGLIGYGKLLRAIEEKDSANILFDRVIDLNPDNREANYYRAYGYYDQARYSDGLNMLLPFVENNDDYYDAMLLLGDFYYAMKQNDPALTWYEKAYEEGGARSANLSYVMAYIYDEKQKFDKAIPLYQEALTYDSTLVDIYRRLGELITDANGNYYRTKAAQTRK